MSRVDVWRMIRRASDAGIEPPVGCRTFRATGNNQLPDQWRPYRGRAAHGRALECENNRPVRIGAMMT
jgi:hypothetical protein